MNKAPSRSGSKPQSFGVVVADAHQRIDYLAKICQSLVLEADPDKREWLTHLVAEATRHGMDPEADNG